MAFMLASTLTAMVSNLTDFWRTWDQGGDLLFVVGLILLVLAVWLLIEGAAAFLRLRGRAPLASLEVPLS
jgi:hypothetical protein